MTDKKQRHAARRVCELFKGRFSEEVALKIVDDVGGEMPAVDFLLNEDPKVVAEYFKNNQAYVAEIRTDSANISSLLENGIEFDTRQFSCEGCQSSWWKKVPTRKMVSKCKHCHTKYDPVPQGNEWGWSKFICPCSNEFHAYGEMGVTRSECYQCGISVAVSKVMPPRRKIGARKKSDKPHSCNGVNCFSQMYHDDDYQDMRNSFAGIDINSYGNGRIAHHNTYNNTISVANHAQGDPIQGGRSDAASTNQAAGSYAGRLVTPVCLHPKSAARGRKVRTPSKKHASTGSTVNTFLSQGSLDTNSIATLDSIVERD